MGQSCSAAKDCVAGSAGNSGAGGQGGSAEAGLDADNPTAPIVVSTIPSQGAVTHAGSESLTATFNEPMAPATINATSFLLRQGSTLIPGTVSYVGADMVGVFTPSAAFAMGTTYTATITTEARNSANNPMASDYEWSFATSACGLSAVALGAAANFVVLAGSTITSTGPTSVTGDLGVSPGTSVTGFPPGTLIGAQHAGDPTSAQGVADLTIAYNDVAGRTLCPNAVSGNLGGLTLTAGLYKSTSTLAISSGDLTLDAQGDADALFLFQIATTLTITAGRQVILSGGARASNVYWQVGTSATLGTTSAFQGTIMADQAITLNTGATLNGRVLARIAEVTLDSNTIVRP
jgi:hypothetical protein